MIHVREPLAIGRPTRAPASRRRRGLSAWVAALGLAVATLAIAAAPLAIRTVKEIREPAPPLPPLPQIDLLAHFYDATPLRVVTTAAWLKIPITVPRDEFLSDPTIWHRMHFEDWDRLPTDVRRIALTRMLYPYWYLIPSPRQWARLRAEDWDSVPQPVQAMATLGMIEYWVDFYGVGRAFDLPRRDVLRTVQAIAMTESWFDHRAERRYPDGTADLGLAGASPFARRTIRRWHDEGLVDFTLTDEDYANPWLASRFLAFWFQVMLEESGGDMDLAIRAYNVGIGRAATGAGEDYLATVHRRLGRYLLTDRPRSPSWRLLLRERRMLVQAWARTAHNPPTPGLARVS